MYDIIKLNLTKSERSITAQFRSGILPLHVETGRFGNNRKDLSERVCNICNSEQVEDETHFAFICPIYNNFRNDLYHNIQMHNVNFINWTNTEKLKCLFKEYPRQFAKFLVRAFNRRRNILFV